MIKAVLFDFDGTVADSSEGIFHSALYSIRRLGIEKEYSDEDLRRFVGPPLRECFRVAFDLDPALIEDAVKLYREEYDRKGCRLMRLYPGIEDLLLRLRAMSVKTAVATFKGERLVRTCLENLSVLSLFDSVHGSNEKENLTKGDIIRMVLSDFSIDGSEALMVGDTINDRKGAEDAGVPFLAVRYGFGFRSPEEYEGCLSTVSVEGIYETIKMINGGV